MADVFESTILCNKCGIKMRKTGVTRNGFFLRAVICPKCSFKILHPLDKQKYFKFMSLKHKEFSVKMRMVGNSYAVSIPKEIVLFMNEQKKIINNMVKLCFEGFGKLSLNFKAFGSTETKDKEK